MSKKPDIVKKIDRINTAESTNEYFRPNQTRTPLVRR